MIPLVGIRRVGGIVSIIVPLVVSAVNSHALIILEYLHIVGVVHDAKLVADERIRYFVEMAIFKDDMIVALDF